MERKWQYLTRKLKEAGFEDLELQANKIDNILVEIYGEENTGVWAEDYGNIIKADTRIEGDGKKGTELKRLHSIKKISDDVRYCTACMKTPGSFPYCCEDCKFGKKAGICLFCGSLYRRFINELEYVILEDMYNPEAEGGD